MSYTVQDLTDSKEWEEYRANVSPQSFFQSWEYGDIFHGKHEKVQRYGVYAQKKLVGIFCVRVIKAKRGIFLHVRHGPILSLWEKETFAPVHHILREIAKVEKAVFIRVSPMIEDSSEHKKMFSSLGYVPSSLHAMDAEYCWVLPLQPSESELLANMRKTTRYEVRRAEKNGVIVKSTGDVSEYPTFSALYEMTAARHQFVGHEGIQEEFEAFAKKGKALLYTAHVGEEVVSTAIVVFDTTQAIYRHGASVSNAQGGSYLIQWEAIKEAKRRGLPLYNFWGIAPPDKPRHPWKGLSLFKTGFGGHVQQYLHAYEYPCTVRYLLPRTIDKFRSLRRGY